MVPHSEVLDFRIALTLAWYMTSLQFHISLSIKSIVYNLLFLKKKNPIRQCFWKQSTTHKNCTAFLIHQNPGVIVTPHNLSIHLYDKNPKLSRSSEKNRKENKNAKSSSIQMWENITSNKKEFSPLYWPSMYHWRLISYAKWFGKYRLIK